MTTGCVANAVPPVDALGCVVNASFAAAPTVIVELAVAEVRPVSAAVNVYVPARSILQPTNVATPATAGSGFALVQVRVAGPAGIDNVTELVSVVTVLPPRSCTFTIGWVAKATPPVEPLGGVVNATFAAAPTETVNEYSRLPSIRCRSRSTCRCSPGRSCNPRTSPHRPPHPADCWCRPRVAGRRRERQGHRTGAADDRVATGVLHPHDRLGREGRAAECSGGLGREADLRGRADRDRERRAHGRGQRTIRSPSACTCREQVDVATRERRHTGDGSPRGSVVQAKVPGRSRERQRHTCSCRCRRCCRRRPAPYDRLGTQGVAAVSSPGCVVKPASPPRRP